jgi:protoporphyrin/coproporphyrin ferrochelatase
VSTSTSTTGVIVMAYGTPRDLDDVEAYYTDIRRGRPPTAEQLAELIGRYRAIGGVSPLAQRTEAQRAAIEAALVGQHPTGRPGDRTGAFEVVLGQKHSAPFVEDAVRDLAEGGVTKAVGIVLAPHFSKGGVDQYHERAAKAAADRGVAYTAIESWHLEPAYLDFLARAVGDARASLPERTKVLFTAHSLPLRSLVGDPYPDQLRESATEVAQRVGLLPWPDWAIAWQSAGRTPDPWQGPDILEVIRQLGATGRSEGVLVCPQGFTSDHLEVLYDLDIEATRVAAEVGLAFARTRSLNDDATVMAALADRIAAAAAVATAPSSAG